MMLSKIGQTLWIGCLWGMLGLLALAHVEGAYSIIVVLVATVTGVISMYIHLFRVRGHK